MKNGESNNASICGQINSEYTVKRVSTRFMYLHVSQCIQSFSVLCTCICVIHGRTCTCVSTSQEDTTL